MVSLELWCAYLEEPLKFGSDDVFAIVFITAAEIPISSLD